MKPNFSFLAFKKSLTTEGGAERFMLEVLRELSNRGIKTSAVVLSGRSKELFDGKYADVKVKEFIHGFYPKFFPIKIIRSILGVFSLRAYLFRKKPDFIFVQNPADAEIMYFATLGTKLKYSLFVPGTMFRFPDEELKYTAPFLPVFNKVRESVIGHKEFVSAEPPKRNFVRRFINELRGKLQYAAVRKAEYIFALTGQMANEIEMLYGKKPELFKGALEKTVFDHVQKKDMKKELGLEGKTMVLAISRLDVRKRIALAVRAFKLILPTFPEAYFIIGGKGEERANIEKVIEEEGLEGRVRLIGFVPEEDLFDYYKSADVFIHPDWVDYDLSIFEPLSLGGKVVCSSEVEIDSNLAKIENKLLFTAHPDPEHMKEALEKALRADIEVGKPLLKEIFRDYTWEGCVDRLANFLERDGQK